MAKFFEAIRAYPGRWIGFAVPHDAGVIAFFKQMPLKAWDTSTKTWWFPESAEPIITNHLIAANVLTREKASAMVAKLYEYQKLGTAEEPYIILGLQLGAPRPLIDLAYDFWKRTLARAGGTGMQVAEVEAAYAAIINAEVVLPPEAS